MKKPAEGHPSVSSIETRARGRAGALPRSGPACWAALLSMSALAAAAPPSVAQSEAPKTTAAPEVMQQRDIERALSAPRTRGLRIAPRTETTTPDEPGGMVPPAVAGAVATAGAGTTAAGGTAAPPATASIALDVPFEINSSALKPSAAAQLQQLAGALRSDELTGFRFLIAGHTDASGDAAYNRKLSGRRADAVRRRLIDAGVAAERLDARGFGEDEPLDPAHPNAAANRRVEIRNLGVAAH